MDTFSQRFSERLLDKHPQWGNLVQWHDGYLTLQVPAPSGRTTWPLYVSTEGGEITVGFDRWHAHFFQFEADDEEEESVRALDFIDQLLAEEVVIVSVMKGDKWAGSRTAAAEEDAETFVNEFRGRGSAITVRSWKGTCDRDIPLQP